MPTYALPETAENLWAEQVTIGAGASNSEGCPTQGRALVGITIPGAWSPAVIGYKGSFDGITFYDLITDATGALIQTAADAGCDVAFPQSDALFRPFIKLFSSDAAGVPVVQAAATDIILTFRRFVGGS